MVKRHFASRTFPVAFKFQLGVNFYFLEGKNLGFGGQAQLKPYPALCLWACHFSQPLLLPPKLEGDHPDPGKGV